MKLQPLIVAAVGLLLAATVAAQTVYESKGGGGKVYSDRPMPGGKPVDLKPLNIIEPVQPASPGTPPAPASDRAGKDEAAFQYKRFAIVSPEQNGSVAANNALFEVRLSIDPPLQVARGHAIVLRLDGRPVSGRQTTTEIVLPGEVLGDAMLAGTQQHVVEASVVDGQNMLVLAASPVSFLTRVVAVQPRPGMYPQPYQQPYQQPVPYLPAKPRPPKPVEEKPVERPATEGARSSSNKDR